jgi:tetratricopeptide (TPR) repeat protein
MTNDFVKWDADSNTGRIERWLGLLLIILVLLAYGQTGWYGFINFDDPYYITFNDRIQNGLTWEGSVWAFTSYYMSNWHPLTWLSYIFDYQLFGLNPAGYHLINVLFHMVNALLLFLVLREATGKLWQSFWVAGLFALHPLHVESVVWISERKDVLCAFFWMLTMLAYVRYARGRKCWYLGVIVFFTLGLMSKPMAVTLPFVLLLLDYWPLRRIETLHGSYRRLILEKLPMIALSAASSMITYLAQMKGGSVTKLGELSFGVRLENALFSYVQYLEKLFYPHDLAVIYPHPGASIPAWAYWSSGTFLMIFSMVVVYLSRKKPFLLTGWFWYLGTMVPVIGIVQVGVQGMADRYTYLPMIGIYIGLVWLTGTLLGEKKWPARTMFICSAAALAGLAALTMQQVSYWRDSERLFRHAMRSTSANVSAHINLGTEFLLKGRLDEAALEFKSAIRMGDNDMAHLNLGVVYSQKGMRLMALEEFDLAMRVNSRDSFHPSMNKGSVLLRMNRKLEALDCFRRAAGLLMNPDHLMHNSQTLNRLAIFLVEAGDLDQAVKLMQPALKLSPRKPETLNNYGRILMLQGRHAEALSLLNRAVQEKPDFPEAYNNLGLCLLELGSDEEALYCFAAALHIRPDYNKARINLLKASKKLPAAQNRAAGIH